eukprot:gnl/Trimastix_PCT/615.p1 GENE.gnl/Trimastix_PCT/615~~gnl/Trimastix_PCT/615.p1  ORF type:complete len:255 (+),score=7.93 gnl/Trimastix_PCT/615:12-776(+)
MSNPMNDDRPTGFSDRPQYSDRTPYNDYSDRPFRRPRDPPPCDTLFLPAIPIHEMDERRETIHQTAKNLVSLNELREKGLMWLLFNTTEEAMAAKDIFVQMPGFEQITYARKRSIRGSSSAQRERRFTPRDGYQQQGGYPNAYPQGPYAGYQGGPYGRDSAGYQPYPQHGGYPGYPPYGYPTPPYPGYPPYGYPPPYGPGGYPQAAPGPNDYSRDRNTRSSSEGHRSEPHSDARSDSRDHDTSRASYPESGSYH